MIDVFVALRDEGKSPQDIKDGMRDAILAIGPSNVSRHCGDPKLLNVFDVGPRSLGDDDAKEAFNIAAEAEVGGRVAKYIPFPKDPGNHFEIRPSGDGVEAPTGGVPDVQRPAPKQEPPPAPAPQAPVPAEAPAPKAGPERRFRRRPAVPPREGSRMEGVRRHVLVRADDRRAGRAGRPDRRRAGGRSQGPEGQGQAPQAAPQGREGQQDTPTDADTKEFADLEALEARVKAAATLAFQKQDTEEVLTAAGLTVSGWYSNIVTGSFLGIPLKVHKQLADRLDRAQSALVGDATINPQGQSAADLGTTLKMYKSKSDLRARRRRPAVAS